MKKFKNILWVVCTLSISVVHPSEDRLKCEALPSTDICLKSLEDIAVIKASLEVCCDELSSKFDTLADEIESKFSPCSLVTPIFEGGFVINQPGKYCLAADITSGSTNRITINADNVLLDLNNHIISGGNNGVIISNQSNVVIQNGKIQNANNSGINVQAGSSLIIVSDVEFRNNDRGIFFNSVTDFKLYDCEFIGNGPADVPLDISSSNNGIIYSCFLHENAGSSCVAIRNNSSNIFLEDVFVSAHVNGTSDFNVNSSSNISCIGCSVSDGTGGGSKFTITDSSNCLFDRCQAVGNGEGTGFCVSFRPSNCQSIIFDRCFASRTLGTEGVGFQFFDDTTASCMINCHAIDNTGSGVRVESGSTSNFFFGNAALGNSGSGFENSVNGNAWHANYASANGTDYVGVPVANIKTYTLNNALLPANTVAWNNVAGV